MKRTRTRKNDIEGLSYGFEDSNIIFLVFTDM